MTSLIGRFQIAHDLLLFGLTLGLAASMALIIIKPIEFITARKFRQS
jgi:hypothetical protein